MSEQQAIVAATCMVFAVGIALGALAVWIL